MLKAAQGTINCRVETVPIRFGEVGVTTKYMAGRRMTSLVAAKAAISSTVVMGKTTSLYGRNLASPSTSSRIFPPSEYDQIVLNAKFYKDLDQGLLSDAEFEEFFDYREKSGVLLYDGDGKGGDRPVHIAMLPKHLDLFAECIYVSP